MEHVFVLDVPRQMAMLTWNLSIGFFWCMLRICCAHVIQCYFFGQIIIWRSDMARGVGEQRENVAMDLVGARWSGAIWKVIHEINCPRYEGGGNYAMGILKCGSKFSVYYNEIVVNGMMEFI